MSDTICPLDRRTASFEDRPGEAVMRLVDDAGSIMTGDGERSDVRGGTRRRRIADEVYETLLSQLMSQQIEPGARVAVDGLARELGVSQTPIRDALNRLEANGLVVRVYLSGYRIAPQLTKAQFDDMVELRLLLEPPAARRAAERMTPAELDDLRRMAESMSTPREGDEHLAYGYFGRRDAEFHDLIAAGGQNRLIREALARLHTHIHLFRLMYDAKVTGEAIEEHDAILEAISTRDPDAAAYAMRRHILRSRDRFAGHFADQDDT